MQIQEMHNHFRLRADKLNSQRTRAILPIHIDVLINKAINVLLRNSIEESLGDDNLDNTYKDIGDFNNLIMMNNSQVSTSFYGGMSCKSAVDPDNMYHLLGYISKSGTTNSNVRITNPNKVFLVLDDYLSGTKANSVVGVRSNNTVYLFEDGFTIDSVTIRYIKKPTVVNITTNTSCDIVDKLHDKIIDMAVDMYAAIVASDNYQQLNNETIKLE